MLRQHLAVDYDQAGAIGRRYRRQDEIGTPYGITVDHQTMADDTVTLRDRDSMQQVRLPIDRLVESWRNGWLRLDALMQRRRVDTTCLPQARRRRSGALHEHEVANHGWTNKS